MNRKLVNYPSLVILDDGNPEVHTWELGASDEFLRNIFREILAEKGYNLSEKELDGLIEYGMWTDSDTIDVYYMRSCNLPG